VNNDNLTARVVAHIETSSRALGIAAPSFGGFADVKAVQYRAGANQLYLNATMAASLTDDELLAVISNIVGMARFRNCNILLGHLRSGLNVGLLVLGVLTILGRVSLTGFLVYFAVLACWAVLTGVAYQPLLLRYADRFSVRLMGSGKALANGLLKIAMRNGNADAVSRHPRMLRLLSM
jgi:hypothetical protein